MMDDCKKRQQKKSCRLPEPAEEKAFVAPIYDLAELVDKITQENKHDFSETDFGELVGKEKL